MEACSRRDFLKMSALGTTAMAGAGLLAGCSQGVGGQKTEGAQAVGGSSAQSDINPQDGSFTAADTDYAALFEPLRIGKLELKNRIVKSAAGSYTIDTEVGVQALDYYGALAEGGAGLIWFESCNGVDIDLKSLKPIADAVHAQGSIIGAQFYGFWGYASTDKNVDSPLDIGTMGISHAMMDVEAIHKFQSKMIDDAVLFQSAGFDAIELNASCDHTFDTFLSRFWNTDREDEYGPQTLENRARIVTELIQGIKQRCGEGLTIQVLLNGIEGNVLTLGDEALCLRIEEAVEFAKIFEKAGADSIQVRSAIVGNHAAGFLPDIMHIGTHGNTGLGGSVDYSSHMQGSVDGAHDGAMALLAVAAKVKEAVSIPVGVVGNMDPRLAPELTNDAVKDGKVDFIVINRPLMADPQLPNKLKEGRRDEVRPCTRCVTCFQSVVNPAGTGYCRVNPAHVRAGSEIMPQGYELVHATAVKNVMVIGGGPAGMEAASIAAQRGHSVSLYEEDGSLGGRMTFAAAVKGPHERLADYNDYLRSEMDRAGVKVVLGTKVDEGMVRKAAPDVVIVATGAVAAPPVFSSSGSDTPVGLSKFDKAELGGTVCVIGGSLRVTDLAGYLIREGRKVVIVSPDSREVLAGDQAPWTRAMNLSWMEAKGVQIYDEASDISVEEGAVRFSEPYVSGFTIACDSVVYDDFAADTTLSDALGNGFETYVIGDSDCPSNIAQAVVNANLLARKI